MSNELLAEYIVARCSNVSHLKIQKLLYYIQGYHLGFFGEPIIDDEFEAWVHGPVSREFYAKIKSESDGFVFMHTEFTTDKNRADLEKEIKSKITNDQFDVIDDVLELLGGMSGTDLELCTHAEKDTWQKARLGLSPAEHSDKIIERADMISHFRNLIVA